ncbi:unnamed protein product, partial [Sphacelaria rigidula]
VLSGRPIGRASALTPTLVGHLVQAWHRPRRPVSGAFIIPNTGLRDERPVRMGAGASLPQASNGSEDVGVVAVILGRHLAVVPTLPWTQEATIMSPSRCIQGTAAPAHEKGRQTATQKAGQDETVVLGGQLL